MLFRINGSFIICKFQIVLTMILTLSCKEKLFELRFLTFGLPRIYWIIFPWGYPLSLSSSTNLELKRKRRSHLIRNLAIMQPYPWNNNPTSMKVCNKKVFELLMYESSTPMADPVKNTCSSESVFLILHYSLLYLFTITFIMTFIPNFPFFLFRPFSTKFLVYHDIHSQFSFFAPSQQISYINFYPKLSSELSYSYNLWYQKGYVNLFSIAIVCIK